MSARRSRDPLESCTGFDWDEANTLKNCDRHPVTPEEAEDIFFNDPLILRSDEQKGKREKRHWALGQTSAGRRLFTAFTVRRSLIRVISVRDQNRRESEFYKRHEEKNPCIPQ